MSVVAACEYPPLSPPLEVMLAVLISLAILWVLWRGRRFLRKSTLLKNIPGPPSDSWLTGCFHELLSHDGWAFHKMIAQTYGSVARIKGLFGADMLYVHDPKVLHHVLVKDLNVFEEQDLFIEGNRMFFGEGILTSLGERHRLHRKMLSPVFAPSNLRALTGVFYGTGHKVTNSFIQLVKNGPKEIDVVGWNTRISLENIAQGGFEYSFDTLEPDSKAHPFVTAAKMLGTTTTGPWLQIVQAILLPLIARTGSPSLRRQIIDALPIPALHKVRDIVDILHQTAVEIYESKKIVFESSQSGRSANDVITVLLRGNSSAMDDEKLKEKEIVGQICSIMFAATDTTSGAMSRALSRLADHKDMQTLLRIEIRQARKENHDHDLEYDDLLALPLLDAVVKETLRLHPPLPMLSRIAREDTVLSLGNPLRGIDGTLIKEIPIQKGTEIYVDIIGSNTDPEIWGSDSFEWRPHRWLQALPKTVTDAKVPGVYSHLMTFLGGGRSCIGFKFAELEMKVALSLLIENLEFSPAESKIKWLRSTISTPNIEGSTDPSPTLPLIVSRCT